MITRLHNSHRQSGFTLIEIMVVVAIIAILAAIAAPEYLSQRRTNGRTEAISALTQLQVEVERCYGINGGYDCCQPVLVTFRAIIPNPIPNYRVTLTPGSNAPSAFACKRAQSYQLSATPIVGTDQDKDNCRVFILDNQGVRSATATIGNGNACWGDQ